MTTHDDFSAMMKAGRIGRRAINLTGKRFGRLVVVRLSPGRYQSNLLWECLCDCGSRTVLASTRLTSGNTRSCGCMKLQLMRTRCIRHGLNKSPEHRTWVAMRYRCRNERATDYAYYGGRGITICERWDVFENFLADMGPKPFAEATIDRIDPDGPYEPGNCRWASRKDQSINQRRFKEASATA